MAERGRRPVCGKCGRKAVGGLVRPVVGEVGEFVLACPHCSRTWVVFKAAAGQLTGHREREGVVRGSG